MKGDLLLDRDRAELLRWIEQRSAKTYGVFEDTGLDGMRFRTTGETLFLSPAAFGSAKGFLASQGVDIKSRRWNAEDRN